MWTLAPIGLGSIGTIGGAPRDISLAAERASAPADGYEETITSKSEAPVARVTEEALVASVKQVALCYEAALAVDPEATATIAADFVVDRTGHAALDALSTNDVQARVRGFSDCVMSVLRAAELGPAGSGPSGRIGVRYQKSRYLEPTGVVDDETRAALADAYGC